MTLRIEQLLLGCFVVLLFSACIPASPPANVSATPGEAAVITQDTYQNDVFRVEYPEGWRVITSPAGAPPSVTFVAPGDCALIIVSTSPVAEASLTSPSCDQTDIQTTTQTLTLGSQSITVAGSAPSAGWDAFTPSLDRITASLKAAS
ncbi:MAG: hypothetical protein GC204_18960 [Chloroflexi bacterium]|nr:hypothetical protein [Chloroflexota bacterium]